MASVTPSDVEFFQREGYLVVRGLFSQEEVDFYISHYMEMRKNPTPQDDAGVDLGDPSDPLKKYPRIIHPHRFDQVSMDWMLEPRLRDTMVAILGEEPFAGQTMVYFKPPGARGQSLHQDQTYLRVKPGTCIAAWMALDRCDRENGGLEVVPGTQDWDVLCMKPADTTKSFTETETPLPEGFEAIPVEMEPGDVLFFNGNLVHGSGPNVSKDRFRRSLIGHYATGNATHISHWYLPAYRWDGSEVGLEGTDEGGRCGDWVETPHGRQFVEREAVGATGLH